jgi:hypothetical protein
MAAYLVVAERVSTLGFRHGILECMVSIARISAAHQVAAMNRRPHVDGGKRNVKQFPWDLSAAISRWLNQSAETQLARCRDRCQTHVPAPTPSLWRPKRHVATMPFAGGLKFGSK